MQHVHYLALLSEIQDFVKYKSSTMSSYGSSPSSPVSTSSILTEERSTRTMADVIRKYKTEHLIDYLRRQEDLDLNDSHSNILRKEKIFGCDFLETTKEEFRSYGLKGAQAKRLADFAEEIQEQKIRSFSSYKTLEELKDVLPNTRSMVRILRASNNLIRVCSISMGIFFRNRRSRKFQSYNLSFFIV